MINDQLKEYVKQQLTLNVSREIITNNLKSNGWTDEDVQEVFDFLVPKTTVDPVATPVVAMDTKPNTVSPEKTVLSVENNFIPNMNTQEAVVTHHTSSGKKMFVVVFILLFILGGLGASAYAYYTGVFVSFPKLMQESISNARLTTGGDFDATVTVDFSQIKDDITAGLDQVLPGFLSSKSLTLTIKGSTDNSDLNNIKSMAVVDWSLGSANIQFETRFLNNTLYGKINKAPLIALFPDFNSFINKWFSYTLKPEDGLFTDNSLSSIYPGGDAGAISKLTKEQKNTFYQTLGNAHFVKIVKRLQPETVTGENSYHFLFDLDREGLAQYFKSLEDFIHSVGKDDSYLSSYDSKYLLEILDGIKDFQGEVWIGRNDKLSHKAVISFSMSPDKQKPEEKLKINLVVVSSNWNHPSLIVAPADSTPLNDLIANSLGDASNKQHDAQIKTIMSNVRPWAEIFYDSHSNSYLGFCSSSDLINTRKSIEDVGGTDFVCKDKSQSYAVGVKFPKTPGYWCVDSTGSTKDTLSLPSGTVCPQTN